MYRNRVAGLLFAIGIAHMIAGLIIGLISTTMNVYYTGRGWSNFFVWTAGGFILGMLFVGFAENIRLLQQIKQKLGHDSSRLSERPQVSESNVAWALGDDVKTNIYNHYPEETIVAIVPSPKENYCLVRFQNETNDYVKVVYTGDTGVQETDDASIRQSVIRWYNAKTG